MRHFISINDLSAAEINRLIQSAISLKKGPSTPLLKGKTLGMIFQKPSMRTRVSFDVAMYQLGGHAIDLQQTEVGIGTRESAADIARVMSRYVDAIMARVFNHSVLTDLAEYATVPVINGLSDVEHPCQAMADLMTIVELKGKLKGLVVAYIGDGNNCAASLALGAVALGAEVRIASPKGYWFSNEARAKITESAAKTGAVLLYTDDPRKTARGADVIYTDVWTSMGQEAESQERRRAFAGYQVNPSLLAMAKPDAIFMHPLPAHYGEEVSSGIMEDRRAVVFQQAENRLHVQKALLVNFLKNPK
ncbi:MAG: ornithine carbamoyltransferase [Dehalococcoidia bacterium]|nr:ornithine carbamoyltransferase [Dehalococcoidia bacterium]